jgi:hypothetical protein
MWSGVLAETMLATGMWQRYQGRLRPRYREASRSHAFDSPCRASARRTNGPARRRILLAKVEDGSLEEAVLKRWLDPAITREEDRKLFELDSQTKGRDS